MSPILQSFASADAWVYGGGGWRKQSGFWDPGQSSYPRSTLAVKAGAGKQEVIPSERSRERLPTATQTVPASSSGSPSSHFHTCTG